MLTTALVDQGLVGLITLTRTSRLNAINAELAESIVDGVCSCEEAGARVVILRAEPGVTTWSAGHDITELPTGDDDPLEWTNSLADLVSRIRAVEIPIIAAVEGGVWGGACELVMTADLVVASRNTTFAITPAKLGVPYTPDGIAQFLANLPSHIVSEMFFTSMPLTAQRAYDLGMVNHLVADSDELSSVAHELARIIVSRAPLTIRATKAEIRAQESARPLTEHQIAVLTRQRDAVWASLDYREGVAAFHDRRSPNFIGQ